MPNSLSRRNLLKTSFITAGALAAAPRLARATSDTAQPAPQPANEPIGVPRGLPGKEGRVVWQHDPAAVPWAGLPNARPGFATYWWHEGNIDQHVVDQMMADGLCNLTDAKTPAAAWETLFQHFNSGAGGYKPGEKIAIKVNLNCAFTFDDNEPDATQQAVLALLESLMRDAGVPAQDITVYDATANPRFQRGKIPARLTQYCRAPKGEHLKVNWVDSYGENGAQVKELSDNVLTYSLENFGKVHNGCGKQVPTCVRDAKYLINMPLLKAHVVSGVTLSAKNHYGTINSGKDHVFIDPANQDGGPMPRYSPLVDIIGSPEIGQKTLLYVFDALIGSLHQHDTRSNWLSPPFNGHHTASLLFSLDPVAIDTVAYDLLVQAYQNPTQKGLDEDIAKRLPQADNYLHEAALAHNAPSGVRYEQGGKPLKSLGVHEHADFSAANLVDRYKAIKLVYNGQRAGAAAS